MNRSTLRSVAAVAVALVLALGLVPLAWADPTGASEVAAPRSP